MRVFLDTEFLDDGRTIELISLGIMAEDGREFYAENADADAVKLWTDPWLSEHVLPYLDSRYQMSRGRIAERVRMVAGPSPEWWGYFADYDWVVLCQLYGRMIGLPDGWPRYCRDLRQELDRLGLPVGQPVERRHHALDDARWIRDTWIRDTWIRYVRGEGAER